MVQIGVETFGDAELPFGKGNDLICRPEWAEKKIINEDHNLIGFFPVLYQSLEKVMT